MATKIPPKNFDNKLSRRKQDLDQIAKNEEDIAALQALPVLPTPAEGDEGKVPKVNSEGGYTLAADSTLPEVSAADNFKNLIVDSGEWRVKSNIINWGVRVVKSSNAQVFYFLGYAYAIGSIIVYISNYEYPIQVVDTTNTYKGIITRVGTNTIYARVFRDDGKPYDLEITSSNITYTPVSTVTYLSVTVTGGLNAISLPDSMTYDDLKALLDVGTVYIVDDDTSDIYSIERYGASTALFRHIGLSTAYVLVDSIEFNSLGGTYSEARVDIHT